MEGVVDSARSFFYTISIEKDTFDVGEIAQILINYKYTHGGDSLWFETGPYVYYIPFYLLDPEIPIVKKNFDKNKVLFELETTNSGSNLFVGKIMDYNTRTDTVNEMYVQFYYFVKPTNARIR